MVTRRAVPVNVERTRSGRVRPVCRHCGRRGRPVISPEGRVWPHQLAVGWTSTPYSPDDVHRDGSTGDLFTCPACATVRDLVTQAARMPRPALRPGAVL